MPSGDPRKQSRPNGVPEPPSGEELITKHFPPSFSGVMTQIGAQVVPFPAFVGGKAIELQMDCGPLQLHLHVDPASAEVVIEEIRKAKMTADLKVQPASMDEVARVASGISPPNGKGQQ